MYRFLLTLAGVAMLAGKVQSKDIPEFSMQQVRDKLYFLYYDSTDGKKYVTKSTLVEFKNFIILIEMPIGDNGSNQKERKDLTAGGEALYTFLNKEFPKKPLKYILSTHWHEHSVSSVLPFIKTGTKVVTTKENYEYLDDMIGDMEENEFKEHFVFVKDSIVIKDKTNEVVGYRFTKDDYPNAPTKDYIFYYMPRYNIMNISCMYHRYSGYEIAGKEVVYGRTEDLYRFFMDKHLRPDYVIRTNGDVKEPNSMIAYDTIDKIMQTGITETEIKNELIGTVLNKSIDDMVKDISAKKLGGGMINSAVYAALRQKRLDEALALARVLCLMFPGVAGFWDTYGEVYYFMGEHELAMRYDKLCRKMDKDFSAGEDVWKEHVKEHRVYWEHHKL